MNEDTVRLTTAQAIIRYLANQFIEIDGEELRLCGGGFGIFGHGNVTCLGEALYEHRTELPLYRGQNEQSMGFAAAGYAKQWLRQRFMFCTASAGPVVHSASRGSSRSRSNPASWKPVLPPIRNGSTTYRRFSDLSGWSFRSRARTRRTASPTGRKFPTSHDQRETGSFQRSPTTPVRFWNSLDCPATSGRCPPTTRDGTRRTPDDAPFGAKARQPSFPGCRVLPWRRSKLRIAVSPPRALPRRPGCAPCARRRGRPATSGSPRLPARAGDLRRVSRPSR